jgi:hypothetical protein
LLEERLGHGERGLVAHACEEVACFEKRLLCSRRLGGE